MWMKAALCFGFTLVTVVSQGAKTPFLMNCVPKTSPGTCLIKSVKIEEKDVIDTAVQPAYEKVVLFENSQMDYLPEAIFKKFPQLETLQASRVGLRKLATNTFSKSPNLKHLDVSGNSIGILPENIFGTCQHLENINFSENRLHLFNAAELIGCSKLRRLNVSSNQLIFMNWDPLDDLRQLELVDVSNNLVSVLTVPKYLKKIVARNNHIQKLASDPSSIIFMLEYLDASKNRLNNIDTLARFPKMTYIDLSYNRMLSIDFALFKSMRSLRELNLANNNIFTVSTSDFKPIALNLVDLSNNELTRLSASDSRGISSTEKLLLNNNYLVSFEVTKGLANFPRLRSVTLDANDWACQDIEVTVAELKAKQVAIGSSTQQCANHQVVKSGHCCRDLGASFDELILLKSAKLAELQRSSVAIAPPTSTVRPQIAVAQNSVSKVSVPVAVPSSETNKVDVVQLTKSFEETESRLATAEAHLKTLNNEKSTLKASLQKAQNEARALGEKLARCKSTVNQRTGQTVLID